MRTARLVVVSVVLAVVLGAASSASADKILFQHLDREHGERMWVMRSDGSGAHRLRSLGAHEPDLSRDGRRLVWNGNAGLMTGTVSGPRSRVRRLRVVSRRVAGSPRWSPSGRQIAVTGRGKPPSDWDEDSFFSQVFVVRPGRGRPRMLRTPVAMSHPDWSPDGRRIVAAGTRSRSEETCTGSPLLPPFMPVCEWTVSSSAGLWVIDVKSGAAREILHKDDESIGYPRWSPDGKMIAFNWWTADGTTETAQVWTVRPDGTGLRQLTSLPGGAEAPAWSPNGRRLAIVTRPDPAGGEKDIATIRADGSGIRVLTHGGINLQPDWSR